MTNNSTCGLPLLILAQLYGGCVSHAKALNVYARNPKTIWNPTFAVDLAHDCSISALSILLL
jgi:hypothetical protein